MPGLGDRLEVFNLNLIVHFKVGTLNAVQRIRVLILPLIYCLVLKSILLLFQMALPFDATKAFDEFAMSSSNSHLKHISRIVMISGVINLLFLDRVKVLLMVFLKFV